MNGMEHLLIYCEGGYLGSWTFQYRVIADDMHGALHRIAVSDLVARHTTVAARCGSPIRRCAWTDGQKNNPALGVQKLAGASHPSRHLVFGTGTIE